MAKLKEVEIERKVHQFTTDVRRATIRLEIKYRALVNQDMLRGGKHMWTREEWDAYSSHGVTPDAQGIVGYVSPEQAGDQDKATPRRY